jgi:hypothetical protein
MSSPAKAYVHILHGKIPPHPDTVMICLDQATAINVSNILGFELGGNWLYDHVTNNVNPDETVSDNVTTSALDALIFNGQKAYNEATDSGYNITYKGYTNAKKFVFKYNPSSNSCINNVQTLVIVITSL